MSEAKIARISLYRHARSESNEQGVLNGATADIKLSKRGIVQARSLRDQLNLSGVNNVYTSPYSRAFLTAFFATQGIDKALTADYRFRERSFGLLEGTVNSDSLAARMKFLLEHERVGYVNELEIETNKEMARRVVPFLRRVAQDNLGSEALVFGHSATIKFILAYFNFFSQEVLNAMTIKNVGLVQITSDGYDFDLIASPGLVNR